jgi:hypothetical protein
MSGLVWVGFALVLLAAFLIRWRLRECPLERDEGEYAYIGQLILGGTPPYGVAANHKFPGAYLAYAAIMACFGQTAAGIHIGMLVVNLASTTLLFFLGRRTSGNAAGLAAAAGWVVMSISPRVFGNAGHLTQFVALCVLGGALPLWRWVETRRAWHLAAAGASLGLAIVFRQTSIVFAAWGLVVVWRAAKQIRPLVIFSAAVGIPLLAMGTWVWIAGVLPQFWRWTFTQAAAYGSEVSLEAGIRQFFIATAPVMEWNWLIWLGAAIGLVAVFRENPGTRWFVAGLLVAGGLALVPGFYFRNHYYIQLLPALALLFGIAVQQGWESRQPVRYLTLVAAAAAVLLPVAAQRSYFLELSPTQVARSVYGANPFPEAVEIARYIRENSEPGDPIAVIGSEPEIYFYAQRRSATSLIYTYPLMEHHRYARELQETMAREIEEAEPKFVVFVDVSTSWLDDPESDRFIFNWANKFTRNYRLEGVADIRAEGSRYVWGPDAMTFPAQSPYLSVYRRIGR